MKRNSGFTILEIIIVLGILALITVFSAGNFIGAQNNQKLVQASETLADDLRRTHIFSREYKDSKSWGVSASNLTSYSIISDDGNGTKIEQTKTLPTPVVFSTPFTVMFTHGTGETTQQISIEVQNGNVIKYVSVSPTGVVTINQ